LWVIVSQFGVVLIFAVWGWLKLSLKRWQAFFVVMGACDFFYTIFLNTVPLEITPFNLPTSVVVAILAGVGVGRVLEAVKGYGGIGSGIRTVLEGFCCVIPIIPLLLNFSLCDQSHNYTAYEQTVNIFRTMDNGNVLFVNGDNYVFPVTYGCIVERMGEHVAVYDRLSLIFKMPDVQFHSGPRAGSWEEKRNRVEKRILEEKGCEGVFYAIFGPGSIDMPDGCTLVPYGTLYMASRVGSRFHPTAGNIWHYYSTESFSDKLERDYMNREMSAYFHFFRGMDFLVSGEPSVGLKYMKLASEVGYNDELLHSDMGVFFSDHGFFEEAHLSLERALLYHEDLSGVYNNWGYYYHKIGDPEKAVMSFRKAVDLKPERYVFLNNLAFALFEAGNKEESSRVFERSLSLKENQPEVRKFMKEKSLVQGTTS
jgi:tetratricopeptide (TPR) repeat protein